MEDKNNLVSNIRWLYPIWIIFSIFSVAYVPILIFEKNEVLNTATNVSQHELLFRLSILGRIVTGALMVYISYYLYLLFEPINRNRALLMLILALISIPLVVFEVFNILAVSSNDAEYIYNCLNNSHTSQIVAEVFWGLWLLPLGMLVIESKYFPKILGYMLIASCFGYLLGVIIKIVLPSKSDFLIIADILAFGELIFALWFVFKGLKSQAIIS